MVQLLAPLEMTMQVSPWISCTLNGISCVLILSEPTQISSLCGFSKYHLKMTFVYFYIPWSPYRMYSSFLRAPITTCFYFHKVFTISYYRKLGVHSVLLDRQWTVWGQDHGHRSYSIKAWMNEWMTHSSFIQDFQKLTQLPLLPLSAHL